MALNHPATALEFLRLGSGLRQALDDHADHLELCQELVDQPDVRNRLGSQDKYLDDFFLCADLNVPNAIYPFPPNARSVATIILAYSYRITAGEDALFRKRSGGALPSIGTRHIFVVGDACFSCSGNV